MRHTLVEANASALYAKDLLTALFLYGIPSNRFTISLKQKFRDLKLLQGSNISLNSSFVSRQSQSPQEYDFSTTPSAYFLLNLSTATELVKIPLHFQLSLNNLLNSTYRDYLSRYRYFADEPGIHLRLNISLKIE
jgi:iron complex outermembrane receptor protein